MTTVAVVGATGTIGRPLVGFLAGTGVGLRLATRRPADAAAGSGTVVCFDWEDPAGAGQLLQSADVLAVIPPAGRHPLPTLEVLADRARTLGVQHVVLVSTLGADLTPGFAFGRWALASERVLAQAGLPWTVVRPNSFMSNFAGVARPGADGTLRLPWGDGACSFVDPADVAATLAAIVHAPDRHRGAIYELTGPAALTGTDVAAILGDQSGSRVRYVPVPLEAVRDRMLADGARPPDVAVFVELHAVMASGARARVTDHVTRLTGRPARSLREWAAASTGAVPEPVLPS